MVRPDHLASTCRDSSSVSKFAVNSRAPNQAPIDVSRVVISSRERGDSAILHKFVFKEGGGARIGDPKR